jgi:CheY-like chemotaxis protein
MRERIVSRPMRILVIESDPVTADVLETTFPNEHEVIVVGSGHAALERIAIGRPFDAVFCEVDPSDMTAKEVFARLEEGSPRTAQRLIFLVAELKAHRAFLERPPKRYLTRPITASALRDAMLALP